MREVQMFFGFGLFLRQQVIGPESGVFYCRIGDTPGSRDGGQRKSSNVEMCFESLIPMPRK